MKRPYTIVDEVKSDKIWILNVGTHDQFDNLKELGLKELDKVVELAELGQVLAEQKELQEKLLDSETLYDKHMLYAVVFISMILAYQAIMHSFAMCLINKEEATRQNVNVVHAN